jgi:hypothetical protein
MDEEQTLTETKQPSALDAFFTAQIGALPTEDVLHVMLPLMGPINLGSLLPFMGARLCCAAICGSMHIISITRTGARNLSRRFSIILPIGTLPMPISRPPHRQ